jgi:hypothetical protein
MQQNATIQQSVLQLLYWFYSLDFNCNRCTYTCYKSVTLLQKSYKIFNKNYSKRSKRDYLLDTIRQDTWIRPYPEKARSSNVALPVALSNVLLSVPESWPVWDSTTRLQVASKAVWSYRDKMFIWNICKVLKCIGWFG